MTRPVVILSFSYAPRLNPRAFRWTAVAEHLAASGHAVEVVTSWLPGQPEQEVRNGVRITRAGWKFMERARGGVGGARTARERAPAGGGRGIASLARRMWRSLAWPDVGANWYFSAVRTARPLLEHAPEAALVSVSPLFTAVAAGHALMRGNAQRRWIIDLGDPFSFLADSPPNNRLLYAGLNARFERAAFGRAAAVSVTNARTAACYAAAFPESAGKLHVIPPLLSAPLAPGASKRTGGPVRIVFLGTLYRGLREPDFLLALFAAARADASPMELHFYGEAGDCAGAFERYRETCAGGIHLHGVVSRDEALAATREADVLVNLGNRTAFQLPSKVVEYAAAGKPVVNIAPHRDDSSIEFFRTYPLALNIISERGAPEAAQVAQFREFVQRTQAAEAAALEAFLRPYRIEQVAAEYARLIA